MSEKRICKQCGNTFEKVHDPDFCSCECSDAYIEALKASCGGESLISTMPHNELIEVAQEMLKILKMATVDANMALDDTWDRSDDGFEAQIDIAAAAIKKVEPWFDEEEHYEAWKKNNEEGGEPHGN